MPRSCAAWLCQHSGTKAADTLGMQHLWYSGTLKWQATACRATLAWTGRRTAAYSGQVRHRANAGRHHPNVKRFCAKSAGVARSSRDPPIREKGFGASLPKFGEVGARTTPIWGEFDGIRPRSIRLGAMSTTCRSGYGALAALRLLGGQDFRAAILNKSVVNSVASLGASLGLCPAEATAANSTAAELNHLRPHVAK